MKTKKILSIGLCICLVLSTMLLSTGCGFSKKDVAIELGTDTTVTDYAMVCLKRVRTVKDVSATLNKVLYYTVDDPSTIYIDSIFDIIYHSDDTIDSNDFMTAYAIGSDGKTKYKADLYCVEHDDYSSVSIHMDMVPQGQAAVVEGDNGTTTFEVSNDIIRFHASIPVPETENFVTIYYEIDDVLYSYEYIPGEERISAQEITEGETVSVDGVGSLTLDGVKFTDDLEPTEKDSDGYIHYAVNDTNNILSVINFTFRSGRTETYALNTFLNVDCSAMGEEYELNVVAENKKKNGFSEAEEISPNSETWVCGFGEFGSEIQSQPATYVIALGTEYFTYQYMP